MNRYLTIKKMGYVSVKLDILRILIIAFLVLAAVISALLLDLPSRYLLDLRK